MRSPYVMQTGPLIMGTLFGFFLNGVFAAQLYDYYSGFHTPEKRSFVYLVGVVAFIEALHLIFSTHAFYSIMAEGFGDPNVFLRTPISSAAMPALNGVVGLCTQMFFVCRILLLSKSSLAKVAACLVGLTACLQCSAAIGLSVQLGLLSHSAALSQSLKTTVTVWLSASVACDLIICIAITTILVRQRLSVNYTPSKRLVNCLIIHNVENGLITTVIALAGLLTYLKLPDSWFYICFEVLLGRMYAVVLLASLNGRQRMRFYFDPRDNLEFQCTLGPGGSHATSNQTGTTADEPTTASEKV